MSSGWRYGKRSGVTSSTRAPNAFSPVTSAGVRGGGRRAEVALLRARGAHVARDEQQGRHLLAVAQRQVAHLAQEPVHDREAVRRDRRPRDRDVDEPRMRPVRVPHGEDPRADAVAPGALDGLVGHGHHARLLLHEEDQVVLARDVAVERHRRESERGRDAAHRDRAEPLGVGDLDGRLDDALDRQLALGSALGVRRDAPGECDGPGELGVGLVAVGRRGVRHRLPIVVGC